MSTGDLNRTAFVRTCQPPHDPSREPGAVLINGRVAAPSEVAAIEEAHASELEADLAALAGISTETPGDWPAGKEYL